MFYYTIHQMLLIALLNIINIAFSFYYTFMKNYIICISTITVRHLKNFICDKYNSKKQDDVTINDYKGLLFGSILY